MKLVIATGNQDKLKEYRQLMGKTDFTLMTLPEAPVAKETGDTFEANAILKAKAYGQLTDLPVVADDSGLVIDYLKGAPGVKSARFAQGDFAKARTKILKLMAGAKGQERQARFECAIAYYHHSTDTLKTFSGTCHGLINQSEQGTNGFAYDAIFYQPFLKKTFGEATIKEKDMVSHRAQAFQKLKSYLIMST